MRTPLFILILLCNLTTLSDINAQRFLAPEFADITVSQDIKYGRNVVYNAFQTGPLDLTLDFYEPVGDDIENRPLVIVIHSGYFLPVLVNGRVTGTNRDSSIVEICTRLAKLGYTAAAINFRQGWNPFGPNNVIVSQGFTAAFYRGIQDGRTAVRYFKNDAQGINQYRIDPNRIVAWGIETGGFVSLGMNSLNDYDEILNTTHGVGKFITDFDGDGIPEPMIIEDFHGDIEGKHLSIAPYNFFGIPAGDTTNHVNHPNVDSKIALTVAISGNIPDLGWVNEGESPIISFNSFNHPAINYGDDPLILNPIFDQVIRTQGPGLFQAIQETKNNNIAFTTAETDNSYTDQAIHNSELASHEYYEGHYPVVNPPNSFGIDEGVQIEWWDPEALAPNSGTPINELAHPSGIGTYHEVGLMTNENMSREKAHRMIDTIFGYFIPRAYASLELTSVATTTVNLEVDLEVFPNPSTSEVTFKSQDGHQIKSIELYDLDGKIIQQSLGINANSFLLRIGNIISGIYVAKIQLDKGVLTRKIIIE